MSSVFVARKALVVLGVRYDRGQRVDMERLSPVLRRRLVEYKRVVPRAGDAVVAGTSHVVAQESGVTKERRYCSDFGGVKGNGVPCRMVVRDEQPCYMHRN